MKTNWKANVKENLLNKYFTKRLQSFEEEFLKTIGSHKTYMVWYKGTAFTCGPGKRCRDFLNIEEGTHIGEVMERRITLSKDISEANGILTYVLNFADSREDAIYLLHSQGEGTIELQEFKQTHEEKFRKLKRFALLADLT